MNKIKLIDIMKELLTLHLSGKLNKENFYNIINNEDIPDITENATSYKETEFICFIFTNIPYYKIFYEIQSMLTTTKPFSKDSQKASFIYSLIEGYFLELMPNISRRIDDEIHVHLFSILQLFYQKEELDSKKTIQLLEKNITNPNTLTNMDTASEYFYEQMSIEGFNSEPTDLREKVSKANSNKSRSIEIQLKRLVGNYFDHDSLEKFRTELELLLNVYAEDNEVTANLILESILPSLGELKKYPEKNWKKIF